MSLIYSGKFKHMLKNIQCNTYQRKMGWCDLWRLYYPSPETFLVWSLLDHSKPLGLNALLANLVKPVRQKSNTIITNHHKIQELFLCRRALMDFISFFRCIGLLWFTLYCVVIYCNAQYCDIFYFKYILLYYVLIILY